MSTINKETIPILLVEDSPSDIAVIQRSLKKGGITNPVHIARDGQEAIDFLHERFANPGVLILDIHLPKVNGIDVLHEAKQIDTEIVAIMLTSHASMKTAIQALRREGAFDYLEKSKDDLPQLVEAVRLAIEKRVLQLQSRWVVESEGSERVVDMKKVQERFDLSDREVDVVKCLCRGDANKEIADRLFISELTVKGHLKKIYQKMDVHNRATLVSKILSGAMLDV
ncbi:MAG: response regulator transcription factor [Candidatus Manganitrophaceae bacterium]|nr:MAG: response regulator transcription factor [Candidatus Manganitrophaceae bacterium]